METEVPYGPERRPWRETVSKMAISPEGELLVSPPTMDPLSLSSYPSHGSTTDHLFQVPSSGHTLEQHQRALKEVLDHYYNEKSLYLSSQGDQHYKCDAIQEYITNLMLLGGGDPFVAGPCGFSLKWMERSILDLLASIWHAKWPHDPSDPETYWGHLMSVDTTEGAYYSLRNARDYLTGKFIDQAFDIDPITGKQDPRNIDVYAQGKYENTNNPNTYKPVLFMTSETNHAFTKASHTVQLPTFYQIATAHYPTECPLDGDWPCHVPTEGGELGPGTVDVVALGKLVDFFSSKGHPIVVVFNYGSSFKGSCDDVKRAGEVLVPILKRNGMYERLLRARSGETETRKGFWFHVDAVLGAFYMPFLEMAHRKGLTAQKPGPVFDFRLDFVSSLAANFHTWGGCPWPAAVYMSKSAYQLRSSKTQFGFFDTVLSCGRNIYSTFIVWAHFAHIDFTKQAERVCEWLTTAEEVEQELKRIDIDIDLWVAREPYSFVVRFRAPCRDIVEKYHLTKQSYCINGELCHFAQVCQMDKEKLKVLLEDLRCPNAFNH